MFVTSFYGIDEKGIEIKGFEMFKNIGKAVEFAFEKFRTTKLNIVVHGSLKKGDLSEMMSFIRQPEFHA